MIIGDRIISFTTISPMQKSIKEYLQEAKTIAVIGISDRPYRTSNHIADYLQQNGYRVIPVNPNLEGEIMGEKIYKSIKDIPGSIKVDIANVFRNRAYSEQMVDEIVEWSSNTGQKPLIWTQLDVSSPGAEEKAANADLPYVRNQCIMVEHGRHGIN